MEHRGAHIININGRVGVYTGKGDLIGWVDSKAEISRDKSKPPEEKSYLGYEVVAEYITGLKQRGVISETEFSQLERSVQKERERVAKRLLRTLFEDDSSDD